MRFSIPKARPDVTIVCATRRPGFMPNLLSNFLRQIDVTAELIVVLHGIEEVPQILIDFVGKSIPGHILKAEKSMTLGDLLNIGFTKASGRVLIKWDDDDRYGRNFALEVKYYINRGHDLVGKGSWLAWIEALGQLYLRFPNDAYRHTTNLAGGTLAFLPKVFKKVSFDSLNIGEDQRFIASAIKKGCSVYSSSPYNYVQYRRKDKNTHSWAVEDDEYLSKSLLVEGCLNPYQYDRDDFMAETRIIDIRILKKRMLPLPHAVARQLYP